MKKPISFIFAAFISVSSCQQENEIIPVNTFDNELAILLEMNISGFDFATLNFDQNLTIQGDFDIGLKHNQMMNDILQELNGQFFMADESFINEISSQFGEVKLLDQFPTVSLFEVVDLSSFDIYSEGQLKLAQPFVDGLLNTEDLEVAKSNTVSFQQRVINSTLSYDEKIQLLTFSSSILGFVEFVEKGGIEKIGDVLGIQLHDEGFPNARTRGCSVNMRNVWLGAVIGGGAGAVGGAKIGCAGGIVAGPIGAAGGCVGGAVMGGASGFISGAIMATGAELLGSCFR